MYVSISIYSKDFLGKIIVVVTNKNNVKYNRKCAL